MSGIPSDASVVVIGAGLSGLVAATQLRAAGISDVVVLEARDRVGGRLHGYTRPNGRELMVGGEFIGRTHLRLHALAASLGIASEPLPPFAHPESMGKFIRIEADARIVESYPMESDPAAMEDYGAAVVALDEMARLVPVEAPWAAASASIWDSQTAGQWIDVNVVAPAARDALAGNLAHYGDLYQVSLLFVLWCVARFGGWEASHDIGYRFVGGSAQIPRRLAERLGGVVFTSCPVRRIDRGATHATVHHDGGATQAKAVVLAMEPGQVGKIEFSPPLPHARGRLQSRWLAGHGAKFFAVYDKPFWRKDGLAGIASGPGPFGTVLDVSPSEADEGILLVLYFEGGAAAANLSALAEQAGGLRTAVLAGLARFFGDQALEPTEFYAFDWSGDAWSQGCGSQVPTQVLSTVGPALRPPVGRLVWAGADNGDMDWMEGAVASGYRAAQEAVSLIEDSSALSQASSRRES